MKEHEFLLQLAKRAEVQERLIKRAPISKTFIYISLWLGNHPWRVIIPVAFLITILVQMLFGRRYLEFILWIFGGL